eukprot:9839658-Alexandrium_andersonii.AAC.1
MPPVAPAPRLPGCPSAGSTMGPRLAGGGQSGGGGGGGGTPPGPPTATGGALDGGMSCALGGTGTDDR